MGYAQVLLPALRSDMESLELPADIAQIRAKSASSTSCGLMGSSETEAIGELHLQLRLSWGDCTDLTLI